MIKQLILTHFVLVEKAHVTFSPHFNIVTGETGSGKTAILEAIALALGARADTSLIRQGCERATVEALFDIASLTDVHALLEEAGIAFDPKEELIVRREISHEGKNKATINCHPVPLPFLQKVGSELIDFIGQNAIHKLRTTEFQRSSLDLFGDLQETLLLFQHSYKEEKTLTARCEKLQAKLDAREKNEPLLRYQLQEIEATSLQEGEDETLFAEYQKRIHHKTNGEKVQEILDRLMEGPSSILIQLGRIQKLTEALAKVDPSFTEHLSLVQQALIPLQEAHHNYATYFEGLEEDPTALEHLENRLSSISRLKKKYGQTIAEINALKQKLEAELLAFDGVHVALGDAQRELATARKETQRHAEQLTKERRECAHRLAELLTAHLQSLNMSKAEVSIAIAPQNRTQDGDDQVIFSLKANPGEESALVREHSSGGELSRLFLALTLALAEKNKTPTLIFDEIDANVGGKTASIIGEKLAELGKTRQIICITHFPQVAAKAAAHFCVDKAEKEGRTVTEIELLTKKQREQELLRMLGGEKELVIKAGV